MRKKEGKKENTNKNGIGQRPVQKMDKQSDTERQQGNVKKNKNKKRKK